MTLRRLYIVTEYYYLQRHSIDLVHDRLRPKAHERWWIGPLDRVDRCINRVQDQIWQGISQRT